MYKIAVFFLLIGVIEADVLRKREYGGANWAERRYMDVMERLMDEVADRRKMEANLRRMLAGEEFPETRQDPCLTQRIC